MTIYEELTIDDIYDLKEHCWSGALDRINEAIANDIGDEFYEYIMETLEAYNMDDKIEITEVNDFIWFDCDKWLEEHKPREEDED
jgi:hypothetical protein